MKYIDADRLRALLETRYNIGKIGQHSPFRNGKTEALRETIELIDSLQQEPTPDTDVLHTELVNLLKTYRIGEETARTMADRIADTYGAQKYMDGLCDGLDEEDTKQEQPEVDLEKEIATWIPSHITGGEEGIWKECREAVTKWAGIVARHFYELGLNARKEE